MNELAQNEAIAQELNKRGNDTFRLTEGTLWYEKFPTRGMFQTHLFTQSLDTCTAFEETLSDEEKEDYRNWLVGPSPLREEITAALFLTPAERCEAVLRVWGKWEES